MTANDPNGNVISAIAKKLTPRILALILIGTLAALTLIISFTLYRGGSVNLKEWTFNAPNKQGQKIINLEAELHEREAEIDKYIQQIKKLEERPTKEALSLCEEYKSKAIPLDKLNNIIGTVTTCEEALSKIQRIVKTETDYIDLKQNYFFKCFVLERHIPQYGRSISTHCDDEKRRETYKLLQEILLELGFYEGDIDGSQRLTRNAVIEFQRTYNEKMKKEAPANEADVEANPLQPLGHVGYRTLEAFRSWYRNNAV